jgi:cellulose synthase/poly-beta-1,6-N-acetylglucosamine synthase-like glycosyltransferase
MVLVSAVFYASFIIWIYQGLRKLRRTDIAVNKGFPSVSIIVPARNEDHNLEETLDSLANQNYPSEKLQVVMVDDRSQDNTLNIMNRFQKERENFTLVEIDTVSPGVSPKKNAIEWGISASNGELIFTTDADCIHSANWIRTMVTYFKPEVSLVTGLTVFEPDDETWIHRLHSLDFLSQMFCGAGAIANGKALNCSGSNLAFRYEAFMELGGYGNACNLISGDDELFLQRLVKSKKWRAVYALGEDSIVRSLPPETIKGILYQRLRWGSKGLYYPRNIRRLLIGLFGFLLILMISPVLALVHLLPVYTLFFAMLLKMGLDYMVVSTGYRLFKLKFPYLRFLALSLLHPLVIVFSTIGGHFLSFKWKGAKFRSKAKI